MFLAFHLSDIVTVPFGYLMDWLYQLTNNYGVTLILFAVIVKIILYPASAKSKKSTMKMSRLTPQIQAIQKKYADDQQKQGAAMQALYKEEGVSMGGGCLWSLLPLLILFPLYTVVRQPITYILHESAENAAAVVKFFTEQLPELFPTNKSFYSQITAAQLIPQYADQLRTAVSGLKASTLAGMDFTFLGIDLGATPQFNIFAWDAYDWSHIGVFLIPVLSAGSQVLSMLLAQKMNNSVVTDENGVQDKETASASEVNKTSKTMLYLMPIMSLWIGFMYPAALSLYWFIQGIVSIVMDVYLTKKYRKIYDAEDAIKLQKAMERDAVEAEKERVRAERRAANPNGITENTSKKKLQQKQQREQEAARAAAAKEYAAKKGEVPETEEKTKAMSGIAERPYCKGRAYDPDRYKNTEE